MDKKMFKLLPILLIGGVFLISLLFIPSPNAVAAKKIIIRFAHQMPESSCTAKQVRFFEKELEKRAKGRIEVQVYPAGQLFKAKELFGAVRSGEVEMIVVTIGAMQGPLPHYEIFDVPFLIQDLSLVMKLWKSSIGDVLRKDAERLGAKVLAAGPLQMCHVSNSKHVIKKPGDFKGLKIRAVGPLSGETIKAFGGSTVVMGGGESYMAMARGTVDGSLTGVQTMFTRNYFEIQKYATLLNVYPLDLPVIANLKFLNSLPKDLQKLIQTVASESADYILKMALEEDAACVNKISKRGMKVTKLSPQERDAFKKASKPVWQNFIKRHGDVGKKLIAAAEKL